jgi:cobalt-zinc-cadmium efflux system protein
MPAEHGHHHGPTRGARNRKRLAVTLVLVAAYMVAEVIGGVFANSLALLADAGHMLSDVAALGLALFAIWFAGRPAPPRRTYGYYRTEILAALVNGAGLVAISVLIFVEAIRRFRTPPEVEGGLLLGVALGGLAINLAGLWILHGGREESLNVKGAWLHVLTDALGSVQAIAAGGLILAFGWTWVDPLASLLIGALVIFSSWELIREAVSVLMESAPGHLDVDEVRNTILAHPGVIDVHDLHIWTIATGLDALSAHVAVEDGSAPPRLLGELSELLYDRFGIDHITIQIEPESFEERRAWI